jgi:hypothetical protein
MKEDEHAGESVALVALCRTSPAHADELIYVLLQHGMSPQALERPPGFPTPLDHAPRWHFGVPAGPQRVTIAVPEAEADRAVSVLERHAQEARMRSAPRVERLTRGVRRIAIGSLIPPLALLAYFLWSRGEFSEEMVSALGGAWLASAILLGLLERLTNPEGS